MVKWQTLCFRKGTYLSVYFSHVLNEIELFYLSQTRTHCFYVNLQVTNGLDIVKKIEAKGSDLGKPKAEVKIVDSGSL